MVVLLSGWDGSSDDRRGRSANSTLFPREVDLLLPVVDIATPASVIWSADSYNKSGSRDSPFDAGALVSLDRGCSGLSSGKLREAD